MNRILFFVVAGLVWAADVCAQIRLVANDRGVCELNVPFVGYNRNIINRDNILGRLMLDCKEADGYAHRSSDDMTLSVTKNGSDGVALIFDSGLGIVVDESFVADSCSLNWSICLTNKSDKPVSFRNLALHIPVGGEDRELEARKNFNRHESINENASYIYWGQYDGEGRIVMLMPDERTTLVDATRDDYFYITRNVDVELGPNESKVYRFELFLIEGINGVEQAIYDHNGVNFRVAPGMVVPLNQKVQFALRSKNSINSIVSEDGNKDFMDSERQANGFSVVETSFSTLGKNRLTVNYGNNETMYLDFFVTEPIETLIDKRAEFIVNHQQHTDSTKWYNGLYSLYDMVTEKLLSPDYMEEFTERFYVGGSDDPSNSKPVFLSEKNVAYPDPAEIASLEYYEKNFVWGKLQRTDKEYPYPWGIYGSENWYENRSGKFGDYGSGGWGKERMWRSFDYASHIAIYYNLYKIARNNPSLVHYLNAEGYLQRAYHTAMAFFEVPYNIYMNHDWAFTGWCEWALKQGNFHERYILDLIEDLEKEGLQECADRLRYEWEKKVTYMVYENDWPFGSEMFVDRTAYESSFYIAQYALTHDMPVHEQFWWDKNLNKWYSYKEYPLEPKLKYMHNQLISNLSIRALYEPGFYRCGTAWTGTPHSLEYMTQMGGVAVLDYGTRFATNPSDMIRYGYNSILASWSLMNTGTADTDYGYWKKGKQNDGAVGWAYSLYENNPPYMYYMTFPEGPWKYDGEIDHGLTGGVHGAGCYIVEDSVFGEIAYGGVLTSTDDKWSVIPWDGVGRYLAIPQLNHFEFKLRNNGLLNGKPFEISRDLSEFSMTIERRNEIKDETLIFTNLPKGSYSVSVNGKSSSFVSDGTKTEVKIRLTKGVNKVKVEK